MVEGLWIRIRIGQQVGRGDLLTKAKGVGDPKCGSIATLCLWYRLEFPHSTCGCEYR